MLESIFSLHICKTTIFFKKTIGPIYKHFQCHRGVIEKRLLVLLSKISQVNLTNVFTLFSEKYKDTIAIDTSHKRHNNVRCHKNTHATFKTVDDA